MKPIIPWMGGKRRLAKQILRLFSHHQTYVEPFCGGAAVFFMKEPSAVEVINDRNGEVVNLYRVVKHHLEEFVRHFRWALVSRQEFLWNQAMDPVTLTDIQRAARFFYLQKLCFGAKPQGRTFGTSAVSPPRLNLLRVEETLSEAHMRLAQVTVECLDWSDCVTRYDREASLFFLDPPYWDTEGYGVEFKLPEYERMAELARTIQGKMVITVNDHPVMRGVFAGLPQEAVDIHYTVGGGHVNASELLIWTTDKGSPRPHQPSLPM